VIVMVVRFLRRRKDGAVEYRDVLRGPVVSVRLDVADPLDDLHAVGYAAKHRVFAVEVRAWRKCDEELRAVGVGSGVCHSDDAGTDVFEVVGLVVELVTID